MRSEAELRGGFTAGAGSEADCSPVEPVSLGAFALLSAELLCVQRFDGTFVWWNQAMESTLGYNTAELDSLDVGSLLHPEDLAATIAELPGLLFGEQTVGFINRYRAKDGTWHAIEWTARADPRVQLVYAAGRDVTARLDAEAALAEERSQLRAALAVAATESKAKSEFLSRVSHEIRNPLNAVIAFAQLLKMDDLPAGQADAVDHILKAGHHLVSLLDDMMDLGRLEAGRLPMSVEPLMASDVVEEALAMTTPMADREALEVESAVSPEIRLLADRRRLVQVLVNLLSNAVKYNVPGGSICVSVEDGGDGWVTLRVADTGVGIDPAEAERVFTPFERLGAESTGVRGTGVGLALSRQLTEAMGGTMEFSSVPGRGSVFVVRLPAAPSAQMARSLPTQ